MLLNSVCLTPKLTPESPGKGALERPVKISNSAAMGVEARVRLAAHEPDTPCPPRGVVKWIHGGYSIRQRRQPRGGRQGQDHDHCPLRNAESAREPDTRMVGSRADDRLS